MKCRHCAKPLGPAFLDLGFAPPSNAYLSKSDLSAPEVTFPLRLRVCNSCWLVQTEDYSEPDEIFRADYAYFSSTSKSWLSHAKAYSASISERLNLGPDSFVIEIASNDGYLLKNFVEAGIPCLGIEPTAATAQAAEAIGVPVLCEFFGEELGQKLADRDQKADLICGNNVFAHVPDINDFTRGMAAALKPEGVITLEFPHFLELVEQCQFDTVYHEHFSYLTLQVTQRIFEAAGLRIFDVERLTTHGGSLRVYGCLKDATYETMSAVADILAAESEAALETPAPYEALQTRAELAKNKATAFLIDAKLKGKTVAAYGAAAKGNTLLNFAGIRPDLLPYVCDAAESKQGKYMPGSHIPIVHPNTLLESTPDYILVLPWNLAGEVKQQLSELAQSGTEFFVAIPELHRI